MSVYQKIVELQDEAERLTGVRPYIDVDFHTYFHGLSDDRAKAIRDLFVCSSSGEMAARDVPLEDGAAKWNCYKAQDTRAITVNVHGPSVRHDQAVS